MGSGLGQFLEIVQEMNPSQMETAALRLAMVRNDENLHGALELYRVNKDTGDLKDTLRVRRMPRELPVSSSSEAR